jgi:protein TonB
VSEFEKTTPNWLLRGFICMSLVIHFFVFLHVAGIYQTGAMSYIELSMHQISKPNIRNIPQPRVRQKKIDISKAKTVQTQKFTIPKLKIEKIHTPRMDRSFEKISLPEFSKNMNLNRMGVPSRLAVQNPVADIESHQEQIEFTSAREYLEMLNLRIHSAKKYPESARSRHLEGRVKLEFILKTDGTLADIKIVKSSRHKNLDDAAIEAVKNASPFPKPPAFIFKEPITLRVNILFELA